MTDLTGGISIRAEVNSGMDRETLFEYLKNIQNRALICASNNQGDERGLIASHAYTMLKVVELDIENSFPVHLVKIRNPHGKGGQEWTGPWMDGDRRWDKISKEVKDEIEYKGVVLE